MRSGATVPECQNVNREQTERAHARGLRAQASAARHVANAGAGPCSSPGVADDECVRLRAHMWHSGRGACSMQPIWASISLNHIFALATALGAAGPDSTMGMCGGLERSQGRGCIARAASGAARSSKCLVPLMVGAVSRCCGTSPKRPARTRAQHECIRCEHHGGGGARSSQ
jgi:hypothetical protein